MPTTPEAIVTLNCLVLGDGPSNVFSVKIARTENVSALKKLIKGDKPITFRDVEADDLVLWEAPKSLHCDDNAFEDTISGLDLQDERGLRPVKRLSQIFPQTPNPDHLHILVKPPTSVQHRTADEQVEDEGDIWTELTARFERTCQLSKETPSAAAKSGGYIQIQRNVQQRICDGRYAVDKPADTNGPPIQLFNPAFAYFSNNASDPAYDVPLDFTRRVRDLMIGFSAIHTSDVVRLTHLRPLLQEILERPLAMAKNSDQTIPDAMVLSSYKHFQIYLIASEEKNEFGDGGSDPSVQASFSFLRVFRQQQTEALRRRCCCPTFFIAHAGPWLAVLGGIITSECMVQRFTDYIWVPIHSAHDDRQYFRIGRVLYALKESIHRLEEWYKTTIETVEP